MYLKIFIILSIFMIFKFKPFFCIKNQTDFRKLSISTRIVGGYRSQNHSLAKYLVSLRIEDKDEFQFGYSHFCAGSIIAKNKILTAAHCLRKSYRRYIVVAKTPMRLNRNENTQKIYIKRAHIHRKYNPVTMFYDIAFLILEEDIILDPKTAAIIPLPKRDIERGDVCQVAGWGRLYEHGPSANDILQTDVHLMSTTHCLQKYPNFGRKKICALNIFNPDKDACVGDSGGPLICGGVLTGIVSYGYGCGYNTAGIYTNVFKFLDWIENNGPKLLKPSVYTIVINLMLMSVLNYL